jgi:hypothetical protein
MTIDDRKGALGLRSRQDVVGTRDNRLFILAVRTVTLVYRDKTLQKTNSRNRYRLNQAELLKKNPNPKTILHLNHGSKLLCTPCTKAKLLTMSSAGVQRAQYC